MNGTKRAVSSLTATAGRYRRLRHVVMLAASGAAVVSLDSAPAHAAGSGASVERFALTFIETVETPLPECFDSDLIGTGVVTTIVTFQRVVTSSGVFTAHGTSEPTWHLDFPNGMYAEGNGEVDHFSFTANGSVVKNTVAIRDPWTVFAADGTPIAQVVIHAVEHITYHDLNGDHEPQPDEISASVNNFVLTCH